MKKIMVLLLSILIIFSGCSQSGISQEDYDKVISECDAMQSQIRALVDEISVLQAELEQVRGQLA